MPLVKRLLGARFACESVDSRKKKETLKLENDGSAKLQSQSHPGRWGTMNDPTIGSHCKVYSCIFIDIGWTRFNAGLDDEQKKVNMYSSEWPYTKLKYTCTRS